MTKNRVFLVGFFNVFRRNFKHLPIKSIGGCVQTTWTEFWAILTPRIKDHRKNHLTKVPHWSISQISHLLFKAFKPYYNIRLGITLIESTWYYLDTHGRYLKNCSLKIQPCIDFINFMDFL